MNHRIKDEDVHAVNNSEVVGDPSKYSKSDVRDDFIEKKFLDRNSFLTEMNRMNHVHGIKMVFMTFLFAFVFQEVSLHFIGAQKFDFALDLILWNFSGMGTALVYWLGMFASTVLFYFGFQYWAMKRRKLLKEGTKQAIIQKWDYFCLFFMISYMITFLMVPSTLLMHRNLPFASISIILCEQLRFLMKKYAFSRTSIPILIENCEDKDFEKGSADLSTFMYFLFAPTLVYRSHYPRKSNTNWKVVFWNFVLVAGIIVSVAVIYKRCVLHRYQDFTREKLSWKILTADIISTTIPMIILHMISFLLLFHAWMNAFAEIMQFSDRMFYKDWWDSPNYSRFFRTWNIVVGDWLYTYIYKDVGFLTAVKDKDTNVYKPRLVISRMTVFIISALFHEYILAVILKFLYPIQFIFFAGVSGTMASFLKTQGDTWNIFLIFSLGLGDAIMAALYSNEWYARKVCSTQLSRVICPNQLEDRSGRGEMSLHQHSILFPSCTSQPLDDSLIFLQQCSNYETQQEVLLN